MKCFVSREYNIAPIILNQIQEVLDELKIQYFDLLLDEKCINKVILGPEFSDEEIAELSALNGAIPFEKLCVEKSIGTNFITNR